MELTIFDDYLDNNILKIQNKLKPIKNISEMKQSEIEKYQIELSKLETYYEIKAEYEAYKIAITYLNKEYFIVEDFINYLKDMIANSYLEINKFNLSLIDNKKYLKYLKYDTRLNIFTRTYDSYILLSNKTLSDKYEIRALLNENINKAKIIED